MYVKNEMDTLVGVLTFFLGSSIKKNVDTANTIFKVGSKVISFTQKTFAFSLARTIGYVFQSPS